MILDKNKAFTFTIDKDENAIQRSFQATRELMERIVEAENLALKNEIEANAVVINGRKYGMIKDHPGLTPTIFGMKVETRPDMPDDWDFFIQQRMEPAEPTTGPAPCPFCGGKAKLHTRQLRFIGQNYLGDKKIKVGAQVICGRCKSRGPLFTGVVINPWQADRKEDATYRWITREATDAWNRRVTDADI